MSEDVINFSNGNELAVRVKIWGDTVGFVSQTDNRIIFQYDSKFLKSGINLSPIMVPFSPEPYEFLEGRNDTFKGLPGFIADALPDKFGTSILNKWVERHGRGEREISIIERLMFQGSRSMGALEFEPVLRIGNLSVNKNLEIDEIVQKVAEILTRKSQLKTNIDNGDTALEQIIEIGTSAGGARPKAVVAYNKNTHEILSGVLPAPKGFDQYLLKLDAKIENKELTAGSSHYCRLEYSYYKMAQACGIDMEECMLIESGQRSHFMTKRFDRTKDEKGNEKKIHMLTLTGMAHVDFNIPQSTSYENLFSVMRELHLQYDEIEQEFRRMVFNVVACNNDDHPKNVSFLYDCDNNVWHLSPAYDLTFASKRGNIFLGAHQMTICGKSRNEDIYVEDLEHIGKVCSINRPHEIIDQIIDVVDDIDKYLDSRIPQEVVDRIKSERTISHKFKSNSLFFHN